MSVYHMPGAVGTSIGSLGTGVPGGCELDAYWELNSGPMPEQ